MQELDERENFKELFDRMRANETQAQVLASRLDNVCDRIESQSKAIENQQLVIDKFLEHLAKQEERSEKRELNFWKYIGILIGAVLALALGPKITNELISTFSNKSDNTQKVISCDWWQGDGNRRYWPMIPLKEQDSII